MCALHAAGEFGKNSSNDSASAFAGGGNGLEGHHAGRHHIARRFAWAQRRCASHWLQTRLDGPDKKDIKDNEHYSRTSERRCATVTWIIWNGAKGRRRKL